MSSSASASSLSATGGSAILFSTSPTATSNPPSSNNGDPGNGTSSTLYLFTFLATLLLLLCVSSAIILRSFILRRRFRRRVEDAILAGVFNPTDLEPFPGRRRRRNFGEKPKVHEAYTALAPYVNTWRDIHPVSATAISKAPQSGESAVPTPATTVSFAHPPRRLRLFGSLDFFTRRNSLPMLPQVMPPAAAPAMASPSELQVAMLVAMPDVRRPHAVAFGSFKGKNVSADDDEELPELVLGVATVPYRPDEPEKPSGSPS